MKKILVALCLLSSVGCYRSQVSIKQDFDMASIKRIGILGFNVPNVRDKELYSQLASDSFVIQALDRGFSVIERSEINKIMKELKLGQSGAVDASMAKEVGHVAGVDAMIFGSILQSVSYQGTTGPPLLKINLTSKMVYVETGEVIWAGTVVKEDYDVGEAIHNCVRTTVKKLRSHAKKMK